jgi:hypothetical protein
MLHYRLSCHVTQYTVPLIGAKSLRFIPIAAAPFLVSMLLCCDAERQPSARAAQPHPFGFSRIRHRAAMRWNGGLGGASLRTDPFPLWFFSRCSVPCGLHSRPSVLRLGGCAGPASSAFALRPSPSSSSASVRGAPNDRPQHERPGRVPSVHQSRHRAAMRCRAGLGGACWPTAPCLRCCLSLCSCHFDFHAVPSALRLGGGSGQASSSFSLQPSPSSSSASFRGEPNH